MTAPATENPTETPGRPSPAGRPDPRRGELAQFLRACRARVGPEDVGLPPGLRRRTPGLRREEVAQLAGVGVTWYTWLEQGRPINASGQVLAAVARTLLLDGAEREHLFRLAGIPVGPSAAGSVLADPTTRIIVDQLHPLPTVVCNSRYDVLLHNSAYDVLFPDITRQRRAGARSNSMWCAFTVPACCNPFVNRSEELPRMVGVLRGAYGKHVGEPAWEDFIRELSGASEEFRRLWARQEVAPPRTARKVFRHPAVGEIAFRAARLAIPACPEQHLVVYTPETADDRALLDRLVAAPGPDPYEACPHRC